MVSVTCGWEGYQACKPGDEKRTTEWTRRRIEGQAGSPGDKKRTRQADQASGPGDEKRTRRADQKMEKDHIPSWRWEEDQVGGQNGGKINYLIL